MREIEYKFTGGMWMCGQLTNGLGPGFCGVSDSDGPCPGLWVIGFGVALVSTFVSPGRFDYLEFRNWLRKSCKLPNNRREANATTLQ